MPPETSTPGWLVGILDRFLPPDVGDDDERRRLRSCIGVGLLALVVLPLPAIDHAMRGLGREVAVLVALWLGFSAVPLAIRRGLSSSGAGHVLTGLFLLTAMINSVTLGGVHSPPILAAILGPAIHVMMVRGRSGWWWSIVFVAAVVVVAAQTDGPADLTREKAVAIIGVMLGLAAAAGLFESSRQRNIEALAFARREAEAAAEAKSRFLANMSHEIRTPLNGVLGMLSILRESRLDPDQRECLDTARSSGRILLELIDEILDFSKIEAGQVTVKREPFALRALVDEALDQLETDAERKGLELGAEVADDVPTDVVGDVVRVRQVLLNLVGNAIKFTTEGHVRVLVSRRMQPEGPPVTRFEVRDTGLGISRRDRERVFEHFQQVDASPSRDHQGTGLGLAIVRELVTLMGGRVGVVSEPSRGSTFWFELPLPESEVPSEPRSLDELPPPGSAELAAGRRVLVVEDNLVNQKVAQRMLERLGAVVEVADDGAQALERIEALDYDLVLMDVQMPGMDGMEATAEIRRREAGSGRRLPVVAMTAHARPEDRKRCLDAGMDDYLTKPVNRRSLRKMVRTHLGGGPPGAGDTEGLAPDDTEVCDLAGLRRDYGDDEGDLQQLAEMFVARAAELLALMRQAHTDGDPDSVARHVHALKGITGTMRARAMFRLLESPPEELATRLPELEAAYEEVRAFFSRTLGARGAQGRASRG